MHRDFYLRGRPYGHIYGPWEYGHRNAVESYNPYMIAGLVLLGIIAFRR